ncbi:MAG: desulfoferrodoxin [Firmicutes bacterium]|nr:desulfoferrodoxin [Bacillota bacterium]MBR3706739.1 desulfoferrodoxin [Bacillota bacterium]
MKYYVCEHCGNIVEAVKESGVPIVCCGQKMTELIPGTTDAAVEKHVPAVEVEGNVVKVKVGEVEHPMVPEHFIGWIAIKTTKGEQKKFLQAGEKPEAVFVLAEGEELIETYEYCNLHGLWKK